MEYSRGWAQVLAEAALLSIEESAEIANKALFAPLRLGRTRLKHRAGHGASNSVTVRTTEFCSG